MAPLTANYSFYIASDDYSDFSMGFSSNFTNLTLLAVANGYRGTYWDSPAQISVPVFLQQGQRYPVRTRHMEAGGGDWVTMAMRIWNTASLKTSEEIMYQSVRERQYISFNTIVVREVQRIVISGVNGGTFALVGASSNPITVTNNNLNPLYDALHVLFPNCWTFVFFLTGATFPCFKQLFLFLFELRGAPPFPLSVSPLHEILFLICLLPFKFS